MRLCSNCIAAIVTVAAAAAVHATTTDTYTFTQTGYQSNAFNGATGTVTGSFIGTVEASGLIEFADLQSFTVQFTVGTQTVQDFSPVTLFSFDTNSGSNLAFVAPTPQLLQLCVGAPAALGYGFCYASTAGSGIPISVNGSFSGAYTTMLPTVQLISSLTSNPPPIIADPPGPAPTNTPEGATPMLMCVGLCVLGVVGLRRTVTPKAI